MNRKKGSFTVEAVYVVPVILTIVMTLIYVLMICHDRGLAYIELTRYAHSCSYSDNVDINIEALNRKLLLYACTDFEQDIESNIGYDSVSIRASFGTDRKLKLVVPGLSRLTRYEVNIKYNIYDSCKSVRKLVTILG